MIFFLTFLPVMAFSQERVVLKKELIKELITYEKQSEAMRARAYKLVRKKASKDLEKKMWGKIEAFDKKSFLVMERLFKEHGEPALKLENKKLIKNLCLILSHAKGEAAPYLPFIEKAARGKLLDIYDFMICSDKVNLSKNGSMLYGSQIIFGTDYQQYYAGKLKGGKKAVNLRRWKMGVEALDEGILSFEKYSLKEGGN